MVRGRAIKEKDFFRSFRAPAGNGTFALLKAVHAPVGLLLHLSLVTSIPLDTYARSVTRSLRGSMIGRILYGQLPDWLKRKRKVSTELTICLTKTRGRWDMRAYRWPRGLNGSPCRLDVYVCTS